VIKNKLKKKILSNLKKNKTNYFSDGENKFFYKDILKKLYRFESFLKLNNIQGKKTLAVIYDNTGIYFWINFLISFIFGMTLMPLKEKSKNFNKIKNYFDVIILCDGINYKIHKNNKRKKNRVIDKTEYISSTSGSTGLPKMILHQFDSIIKNSLETTKRLKFKSYKNFLISIPGFYNSAVCHFFTCLIKNLNFFYFERFNFPKNLNHLIHKYKINYFGGAPIQADWIIKSNLVKKTKLEKIISSGDFLSQEIINLFLKKKLKINLYNIYGVTEVGGRVFISDIKNSKNPYALGNSLKHFKIIKKKISTKIFEIGIKSNFNFLGYYSKKLSYISKKGDIYFTNDLAIKFKKDLILQGRKNEIFKSSGIKIFPEYIKNKMLKLKKISNVFVFSKNIEIVGNMPVAAYESKKKINDNYLFKTLEMLLPKNHIPIRFKHYKKFPYLNNKKINKLKIKNEF
jgi:o-succinylbenzoate---CoA ligase